MFGEDCCCLLSSLNTVCSIMHCEKSWTTNATQPSNMSHHPFAGKKPDMTWVGTRERVISDAAKVVKFQLSACVNPQYLEMWNVVIYCTYPALFSSPHTLLLCKGDKNQKEMIRCDHQTQYEHWAYASNLKWTILLTCVIKTSKTYWCVDVVEVQPKLNAAIEIKIPQSVHPSHHLHEQIKTPTPDWSIHTSNSTNFFILYFYIKSLLKFSQGDSLQRASKLVQK